MTAFAAVLGTLGGIAATVTIAVNVLKGIPPFGFIIGKITPSVAALVVGVVACVGWQYNAAPALLGLVPALVGHATRLDGVSGQVLTGLVAGAFAGFWHEVFGALRTSAGKSAIQ